MLRRWVLGFGVALLLLAVLLFSFGARNGGIGAALVWGALLAGGVYFERYVYKEELTRPPGPGWVRTEEKSVDEDGVVTVWFNPATGERAYVKQPT